MADTAKVPKKPPHLKELFKTGVMVDIPVSNPEDPDNPTQIQIWVRKPTVNQHEEALTKGRSVAARRRNEYRVPDNDLYISMMEQVNEFKTKEELAERLVVYEEQKYQQQAYNEILFPKEDEDSDEEPRWGRNGHKYLDLLTAIRDRYDEILSYNDELVPGEEHLTLSLEDDEELIRLTAEQEEFQGEVDGRYRQIRENEVAKLLVKSTKELRDTLVKRLIELDVGVTFYQEYKSRLIYFSCRFPDQKDRLYWDTPNDIWEQPQYVQAKILAAVEDLEMGAEDIKNSLSLLPS